MSIEFNLTELGRRLRAYRMAKNLTQGECAKRSGIGKSTYYLIEKTGKVSTFDLQNILITLGKIDELGKLLSEEPIEEATTRRDIVRMMKKSRVRVRHRKTELP